MRDNFHRYQQAGISIFGINPASVAAHARYVDRLGFPFPLLSDAGKEVALAYGAIKAGGGIQRSVFGLSKGVIRFARQGMPTSDEILGAMSEV